MKKVIICAGPGGASNGSTPVERIYQEDGTYIGGLPPVEDFPRKYELTPAMREFWEERRKSDIADANQWWALKMAGKATEVEPGYFVL